MLKRIFYTILCFAIIVVNIYSQNEFSSQTYSEQYDLHFENKIDSTKEIIPWRQNYAYILSSLPLFSEEMPSRPYEIVYSSKNPFAGYLETEWEQRMLMPSDIKGEISIQFECKGSNVNQVYYIVSQMDDEEVVVRSDTLRFVPNAVLTSYSMKIIAIDPELLNIKIHAIGEKKKNAKFTFSKLSVFIGNKNLDEYPVRRLSPLLSTKLDNARIIPLRFSGNEGFGGMEAFDNCKIISFGESVHFNRCVQDLAYNLLFLLIKNFHCKLVLLEKPLEETLSLNRYLQDSFYVLPPKQKKGLDRNLLLFLYSVKNYNSALSPVEKVRLYGVDYNCNYGKGNVTSSSNILDFITSLYGVAKTPSDHSLLDYLKEGRCRDVVDLLDNERLNFEKFLTADEIKLIIHILRLSEEIGPMPSIRYLKRDSVMYVNTEFLIERFAKRDSKVGIYTHAVHSNPVSTYPAVPCLPFGYYMRRKYGRDYFTSALLINTGSTNHKLHMNFLDENKVYILRKPPLNSAEYAFNNTGNDIFYYPLSSDFDRLLLSRFLGIMPMATEFYPMNLYRRFSGIFYITKCDE